MKKGAKKQRLLWASTSVKNPAYPDTLYVAPLVGPDTVSYLILYFLSHSALVVQSESKYYLDFCSLDLNFNIIVIIFYRYQLCLIKLF